MADSGAHAKRVWARDLCHVGSRLPRKALMHTVAVPLNGELGIPPLQLAQMVAENNAHIGLPEPTEPTTHWLVPAEQ